MASITGLDDLSHPQIWQTRQNVNNALFLRIPLEVRDSIYKLVAKVDEAIAPMQLDKHSNQFEAVPWSDRRAHSWKSAHSANRPFKPSSPLPPPFTTTLLSRTCRQIYHELQAVPVFYRENSFKFCDMQKLHVFLAALTPARRASLRTIILAHHSYTTGPRYGEANLFHDVIALLTQCTGLQELRLEWTPIDYLLTMRVTPTIPEALAKCTELADTADNQLSLWSFACLNVVLIPSWLDQEKPWGNCSIHIAENKFTMFTSNDDYRVRIALTGELASAYSAFLSRRLRLMEAEERGGDIKTRITDARVQKAIHSSGVHFPGEDRASQNKFTSTAGHISSRTRRQCASKISDSGVIADAAGISRRPQHCIGVDPYYAFNDVRWDETFSLIECLARLHDPLRRNSNAPSSEATWRPLDEIISYPYSKDLQNFYWHKFSQCPLDQGFGEDFPAILETLKRLPHPRDVRMVIDDIVKDETAHDDPIIWRNHVNIWNSLGNKYDSTIEKLEAFIAAKTAGNGS
ncbi:hypothetical protein BX600DRAFT_537493 [Xylariales sp. PMI_506]|nr:hypothetical protein BX600DRAFT_537493 [Xylariales sp. PMI_506]